MPANPATRNQAGTNIEAIMQPLPVKPSKETVRRYTDRRVMEDETPPSVEEIRRQMGWNLSHLDRNRDERDE